MEKFREIYSFFEQMGPCKTLQYMCFRKCCFCIPLRCGVVLLIILQMACLTPFTVHAPTRYFVVGAIVCMVLLCIAAIAYMWAVTGANPFLIILAATLSLGELIFHFVIIDYQFPKNEHESKERIFFAINIVGIVSYFYLLFMFYNTYAKMKRILKRSSRINTVT